METKTNAIMKELIAKGYDCQFTKTVKNGISKEGIIIKGKNKVAPIYYADSFDGDYKEVAEQIANHYERTSHEDIKFDPNSFIKWENVKNTLGIRVRGKCQDDVVTREYLDLEVYVVSYVDDIRGAVGTISVKESHLNMWGITEDELFETAMKRKEEYTVQAMGEVMPFGDGAPMWLLSNKQCLYGASIIMHPEYFEILADKLDDDLYILPSSLHELIVIPAASVPATDIIATIREVNMTVVDPTEILSYSLYKYNKAENTIEVV